MKLHDGHVGAECWQSVRDAAINGRHAALNTSVQLQYGIHRTQLILG